MDRAETAIAGGSLGGLTSCYAASKLPQVFSRAICLSPSVCFDYANGGLAQQTRVNLAATTARPKAVIMVTGAEVFDSRPSQGPGGQLPSYLQVVDAFAEFGVSRFDINNPGTQWVDQFPPTPFSTLAAPPPSIVSAMLFPGGQHSVPTWQAGFHIALQHLYRPSRPFPFRVPTTELMQVLTGSAAAVPAPPSGDDDDDDALDAAVIILGISTAALAVSCLYLCWTKRTMKNLSGRATSMSANHTEATDYRAL